MFIEVSVFLESSPTLKNSWLRAWFVYKKENLENYWGLVPPGRPSGCYGTACTRIAKNKEIFESAEISNRNPTTCVEHIKCRCSFTKKTYESLTCNYREI